MFDSKRKHRLYLPTSGTMKCYDCKREWTPPNHLRAHSRLTSGEYGGAELGELSNALLAYDQRTGKQEAIGYCGAQMYTYLNPTKHRLNLSPIGIMTLVEPGEIVQSGERPSQMARIAPQLMSVTNVPEAKPSSLDLVLSPLSVMEALSFSDPRARQFDPTRIINDAKLMEIKSRLNEPKSPPLHSRGSAPF